MGPKRFVVQSFLKDLKKSTCLSKMSQDIFFHKYANLVGNQLIVFGQYSSSVDLE